MNRERFIKSRRDDWQQFERLLTKMHGARMAKWTGPDVTKLATYYRSVCYDLSLVQSREWGVRLEQYLNDLVARGHNCLYRSPPRSLDTALQFLSAGFPQLLRQRRAFFFVALALFAVPFLSAMFITVMDPGLAEQIVDQLEMSHTKQTFSQQMYTEIDVKFAEERTLMASFYVWHNVGVALRSFALGIFFGLGTIVTLLFNGLSLGAKSGYLINCGYGNNFFSFVISHGSFEVTAIVVAGAGGLLLGWGMIHPGNLTRLESLRVHGIDAIKLAAGSAFMLVVAAFIEAYFSPLAIPHIVKYVIGTMLWILVFVYLAYSGRTTTDGNALILHDAQQQHSGNLFKEAAHEG